MKRLNILRLGLVGATLVISVLVQAREVSALEQVEEVVPERKQPPHANHKLEIDLPYQTIRHGRS